MIAEKTGLCWCGKFRPTQSCQLGVLQIYWVLIGELLRGSITEIESVVRTLKRDSLDAKGISSESLFVKWKIS